MTEPYSLAAEPWIPVAAKASKREFIRIRDIGRQDLLRINTGRADCDISLTEFLIGLLAISMGPSDNREWRRLYETPPSADDIEAGIEPFARALVLDGDGPRFFQDYEALTGDEVPVSSLLMEMPGAQTLKDNADHFVKRGGVAALSRRGAAIALLTLQMSAPSGGAGHRTSLRGGGPVTTLVIPRQAKDAPTFWQLLWTNVPEGLKIDPSAAGKVFPWLAPSRISEGGKETTPEDVHPAQAFFGMPRRIRLTFSPSEGEICALTGEADATVVRSYVTKPWGTNYPSQTWRHPLSPYYRVNEKSQEWLPLHFKSSAVGYRQWVGLTLQTSQGATSRSADNVSLFLRIRARSLGVELFGSDASLLACGYAMDNMKPLDFTEAMLPLISTGDPNRDMHLAACATAMVDGAGAAASLLLTALKVALYTDNKKAQPGNDSAPLSAARARFWADTENAFYDAIRDLAGKIGDDPAGVVQMDAKEGWRKTIRDAALAIFDDLAPVDAPESADIKNIVSARSLLVFAFEGRSKTGGPLWSALGLTMPVKKEKTNGKGRKAA